MAEGRMLKRKISTDGRWAKLANDTHRLLFTVGIAHLDVEGRISGDPMEFKGIVAPLLTHITEETVMAFFDDANKIGLIKRYYSEGKWVIFYPGFKKNQKLRPDREAQSVYPPPPEEDISPFNSGSAPGVLQECSGSPPAKDKIREEKIKEDKESKVNRIEKKKKEDSSPEISSEISSLVSKIFSFSGGEEFYLKTIQAISSARKSGKISQKAILSFLKELEKYPSEKIKAGIEIYLEKEYFRQGKDEKYLLGIIQRCEPEQKGVYADFKRTENSLLDEYYSKQAERRAN